MKPPAILLIVLLAPLGLLAVPGSDLLPPPKRAETLNLARTLLTIKAFDSSEEALASLNPFNPVQPAGPNIESKNGVVQSVAPVLVSDRELLEKLAEEVIATGMMQQGDRTFLLIGKKRFKVGERLAVNSGGIVYEVEISFVDRTSFTLRLNKEEITRPIRAKVKKP